MELLVATFAASIAFFFTWVVRLRRDLISAYLAAVVLALHFFMPAVFAASGSPTALRYADDGGFLFFSVLAYIVLVGGLAKQADYGRSKISAHSLDRLGVRAAARSDLALWTVVLFTAYLLYRFGTGLGTGSMGMSRSELLLLSRQDSGAAGSWQFLEQFGVVWAYASLFRFVLSTGLARKFGVSVFYLWFFLQGGILLLTSLHRSPIIFLVLSYLVVTHVLVRRIPLFRIGAIAVVMLVPVVLSGLADIRAGTLAAQADRDFEERLLHGSNGFATALEFYSLSEDIRGGRSEYEYGAQLLNTAVVWVPRAVWPSKPDVSFSFRKTNEVYGRVGPGNWVRTFTVWGEGFAQFGYFGMALYSIFLVLVVRIVKFLWAHVAELTYPIVSYVISFPLLARTDLFSFVPRIMPLIVVGLAIIGVRRRHCRPGAMASRPGFNRRSLVGLRTSARREHTSQCT